MDGLTLVRGFGCDEPMPEVSLSAFLHAHTGESSLGGELVLQRRTIGSVTENPGLDTRRILSATVSPRRRIKRKLTHMGLRKR